jgi:hypothetical protein
MASTFMIMEIAHTHFWSRELGSNKSDSSSLSQVGLQPWVRYLTQILFVKQLAISSVAKVKLIYALYKKKKLTFFANLGTSFIPCTV